MRKKDNVMPMHVTALGYHGSVLGECRIQSHNCRIQLRNEAVVGSVTPVQSSPANKDTRLPHPILKALLIIADYLVWLYFIKALLTCYHAYNTLFLILYMYIYVVGKRLPDGIRATGSDSMQRHRDQSPSGMCLQLS